MINIIDEALKDALINKKWIIQKKLFPVVVKDKNEIKEYRKRIEIGLDEIIVMMKNLILTMIKLLLPQILSYLTVNLIIWS